MLSSSNSWTPYIVLTALTVSVLGIFIWSKRRRNYVKVGKISKLFFYPVKSLKAVEVTKGACTKFGFEVNGLLDRSFMLIDENGKLVSMREVPSLVLLTPLVEDNYLTIKGPNKEFLKLELKKSLSPNDKVISCLVHGDTVEGIDCGDESASFFESYTKMKGVRLVRFFPAETVRKYTSKDLYFNKIRKNFNVGFQDGAAFHVLSKASVDDVNSKQNEKEITVYNFRPNIFVDGCEPYAEDSWRYLKFDSGVELYHLILVTRCLLTTTDMEKGTADKREPMISLRKYRIAADPDFRKKTHSIPCLGTFCGCIATGEIQVGDDVFAVIGERPKMAVKED